ncbi:acetyl-coenzyme A transporter 1-domain-containing protein [Dipodascopsis uninucleata]
MSKEKINPTLEQTPLRARKHLTGSVTKKKGKMFGSRDGDYYEDEDSLYELEDLGASNFDGQHHVSVPPRQRSSSNRLPTYDLDRRSPLKKSRRNSDVKVHDSEKDGSAVSSLLKLPPADFRNFILLCILYLLQGIPVGLGMGSIPFLLKSKLSYGQVGLFSLASYPYSMKLLWSPIVDAVYSRKIGRRKSWIIPIQTVSAFMLLWLGRNIDKLLENAETNLGFITFVFFILVLLCATQDVAVDGWALTLLSHPNLSYASTAQTIGLNTGYFLSFTVFLALNSPEFANKYFRAQPVDYGLLSMRAYLTFWGWTYLFMTVCLLVFKTEEPTRESKGSRNGLVDVYRSMWKIVKLSNVQLFILVLLVAKIGFQANDAVTNLKLLEKGLSKEDLAVTVLIDFPFEIIFGYYAAKWSVGNRPLKPWLWAFVGRLGSALLAQLLVICFPSTGASTSYLFLIILVHVLGSFMSTVQFVSINAFHTQIADPAIGGTYMTTLNTISNLGGQWPRVLVLFAVDYFTKADCVLDTDKATSEQIEMFTPFSCSKETERQQCTKVGGRCDIKSDGYYITNIICVTLGALLFFGWIRHKIQYVQTLSLSKWRVDRS